MVKAECIKMWLEGKDDTEMKIVLALTLLKDVHKSKNEKEITIKWQRRWPYQLKKIRSCRIFRCIMFWRYKCTNEPELMIS